MRSLALLCLAACTSQTPAGTTTEEDAAVDTYEGDVIYADDPVTTRPDEGLETTKPDTKEAGATDAAGDAEDGG